MEDLVERTANKFELQSWIKGEEIKILERENPIWISLKDGVEFCPLFQTDIVLWVKEDIWP